MNILILNADLYDNVVKGLKKRNQHEAAAILIRLKKTGEIKSAEHQLTPVIPVVAPIIELPEGELSDEQKRVIKTMQAGGTLHSLRWDDKVYCCLCYQSNGSNVETFDVEILLKRGIIEGIVQNIIPVKTYVLTDFGKAVKA